MNEKDFLDISSQVIQAVFMRENPYSLEQIKEKFAFDIKLPVAAQDSETGEGVYTAMPNAESYVAFNNADRDWMLEKRPVNSLDELIKIWKSVNPITGNRAYNCQNVYQSDPVYASQNVYNCTNCGEGKNILFCDSSYNCAYCIACQRSSNLNYCIRVDDSNACSNSYNVICSGKISNSLFIQDANSLHECIFCSHIENHEYCIANMQYDKAEYEFMKKQIITWIFNS